jgi:thymidylate kinase
VAAAFGNFIVVDVTPQTTEASRRDRDVLRLFHVREASPINCGRERMHHTTGTATGRSSGHKRRGRGQISVSFSGLDGAGKTHQIDALLRAVAPGRSAESIWMPFRIWPATLLNRLPARYRSRLGPNRKTVEAAMSAKSDPAPAQAPRNRAPEPLVGKGAAVLKQFIWTGVGTFAAISAGLSLRRRSTRSTADLVVFDRYRLDTVVKLQYWYADLPAGWLAWIVHVLAPAPSVEVVLRVDPQVAYQRKQEQWTVDQLTRQAGLYDRAVQNWRGVVVVDANDDPDKVVEVVESHVRAALRDH